MPVELKPIKHKEVPLEFYDQRIYPSVENIKVGYNGHANLIFSGEKLQIDYVDLTGTVVYSESFKSDLNRFAKGGM